MDLDLENLKEEILRYVAAEGFAVFRSQPGSLEGLPVISWDSAGHPDYRAFLEVAKTAGARIIVFAHREFAAEDLDDAQEQLEDCDLGREEQRSIERSLSEMRRFVGFTCSLEMAFDHQGRVYVFELMTEWFQTFAEMTELLLAASAAEIEEDDEDESDSSFGGYFSKN